MRYAMGVLMLCVVLGAATPTPTGGFGVVTLMDVPEFLRVGTEATLTFKIRQHGRELATDRSPVLLVRDGTAGLVARMLRRDVRRIRARTTEAEGVYAATITPESAGALHITVDMDLWGLEADLLPFPVVAADAEPPVLTTPDRGRQLFSAKGCVTCHRKLDDPALASLPSFPIGPELTGRTFPDAYVATKLRDPSRGRVDTTAWVLMPRLELTSSDVDALVAYINSASHTSPQVVASRSGGY